MNPSVLMNTDLTCRYHVAIIGGGPAGLAAASVLSSNNIPTILFEAGKDAGSRNSRNPDDVSRGVGGGGLFADGKLSFPPSASKLRESYPESSLELAYAWFMHLLGFLNVGVIDGCCDTVSSASLENLKLYPSVQLNAYQRTTLLNRLLDDAAPCVNSGFKIIDVSCSDSGFVLTDECATKYYADKVIFASGRYGSSVARNIVSKSPKSVYEIGVRFEASDASFDFVDPTFPDFKLIKQIGIGAELRTFCCARQAAILETHYDNLTSFNGARMEHGHPLSNIGLVIRSDTRENIYHEELRNYIEGDITPFVIKSSEFLTSNRPFIGRNVDSAIKSELKDLFGRASEQGVVYGPEIERIGTYYFDVAASLDDSNNVWMAGDATGRFRGLSAALLSGAACAFSVVTSRQKAIKRNFGLSKVNTSDVANMKLVFTAQSKKFFYCRDAICEYVLKRGCLPVNPFRVFGYFLGDRVDREIVRRGNNKLIRTCSELWVFGPIADGVLFEIMIAKLEGMPIRFFTVATQAHEIEELLETKRGNYSRIKFEPEVHARRVSKRMLLNTIMGFDTQDSQLELFNDEGIMLQ